MAAWGVFISLRLMVVAASVPRGRGYAGSVLAKRIDLMCREVIAKFAAYPMFLQMH